MCPAGSSGLSALGKRSGSWQVSAKGSRYDPSRVTSAGPNTALEYGLLVRTAGLKVRSLVWEVPAAGDELGDLAVVIALRSLDETECVRDLERQHHSELQPCGHQPRTSFRGKK